MKVALACDLLDGRNCGMRIALEGFLGGVAQLGRQETFKLIHGSPFTGKSYEGFTDSIIARGAGPGSGLYWSHVPNPKQVIARCHLLMCQEGILTIAVPNDVMSIRIVGKTWIKRILSRCGVGRFRNVGKLGLPGIALDGSFDEIHLSHFTPTVLQRLLEGSGFEIIENSLDPFYVAGGIRALLHRVYYLSMTLLKFLLKKNYYETLWVVAK